MGNKNLVNYRTVRENLVSDVACERRPSRHPLQSTPFIADTVGTSLARVRNSKSLFQSNFRNLFFSWDLAAVRFIGVSVKARCPQGES